MTVKFMRIACAAIVLFVISHNELMAAGVDTTRPGTCVDIRARIFLDVIRLKVQPGRKFIGGKKYLFFDWNVEEKLVRLPKAEAFDLFATMSNVYNMYIEDFILYDSIGRYAGIRHSFYTDGSDQEYDITKDFDKEIIGSYDGSTENNSLALKAKMFLHLSTKEGKHHLDSVHKVIVFKGDETWKTYTDRYARFVYAYVLRHRHHLVDKIVFQYLDKKKLVSRTYYTAGHFFDKLRNTGVTQ